MNERTSKKIRNVVNSKIQADIFIAGGRRIKIVLTIAHLDHDEENHSVRVERLAALCQRCHLRYDIAEKKRRRFNKKAVGTIL